MAFLPEAALQDALLDQVGALESEEYIGPDTLQSKLISGIKRGSITPRNH